MTPRGRLSMNPELSEAERFPLLTPAGRKHLHAMREDPHAPVWNWPNGEQLDAGGLARVRAFAASLHARPISGPGQVPDWLPGFVDICLEDVPFYRSRSRPGAPFSSIPSCNRSDLALRPWEFVPDSQSLDRLIVFSSTGTTGHPAAAADTPCHGRQRHPAAGARTGTTGRKIPARTGNDGPSATGRLPRRLHHRDRRRLPRGSGMPPHQPSPRRLAGARRLRGIPPPLVRAGGDRRPDLAYPARACPARTTASRDHLQHHDAHGRPGRPASGSLRLPGA